MSDPLQEQIKKSILVRRRDQYGPVEEILGCGSDPIMKDCEFAFFIDLGQIITSCGYKGKRIGTGNKGGLR